MYTKYQIKWTNTYCNTILDAASAGLPQNGAMCNPFIIHPLTAIVIALLQRIAYRLKQGKWSGLKQNTVLIEGIKYGLSPFVFVEKG